MRNMITRAAAAFVAVVAMVVVMVPAAGACTRCWDPNTNQRFIFSMYRNGTTDVYSNLEDGTSLQRLTSRYAYEGQPSFNRGRDKFVFLTNDFYGRPAIILRVVSGGEYAVVESIRGFTDTHPALSPDGSKVAFTSNRSGSWQVWLADTDSTPNLRQVTRYGGQNTEPAWSPDGTQLAFTTTRFTGANEVATMPAEGGYPNRVSFGGGQQAVWSPWDAKVRAQELAYAVKPNGYPRFQIHRQLVNSSNVPVVVANLGVDATDPAWSPDGKRIMFSTSGGYGPLYSADAAGGNLRMVMSNNGAWIGSAHWGYPLPKYTTEFE